MNDFEIIDAHVHFSRDIEQERQNVFHPSRRDRDRWGNPESIIPYMNREGISKIVCLNLFPTEPMRRSLLSKIPANLSGKELEAAKQQVDREVGIRIRRHNEWLCQVSKENPRVVAGIGIQKLLTPEEMVKEVELRVAQGAKTVKLLPGLYREFPNDHAFWPMYKKCEELGIAVTPDSGSLGFSSLEGRYPGEKTGIYYGEPMNFIEVLESFPKLTMVMCHFASAFWDERIEMAKRFPNLNFDISGGFNAPDFRARDGNRAIAEEDAVRVMRKVGIERMMFGTDGPGQMVQPCVEQILRLSLTEEEKRLILAENAKRIYKI